MALKRIIPPQLSACSLSMQKDPRVKWLERAIVRLSQNSFYIHSVISVDLDMGIG